MQQRMPRRIVQLSERRLRRLSRNHGGNSRGGSCVSSYAAGTDSPGRIFREKEIVMKNKMIRLLRPAALAIACAVMCMAPFARSAKAEAYTERTAVTFSNDVQIPGYTLAAGTYIFEKAPDLHWALNLDTIQIWDATGTHLIATENTVPASLANAPDKPVVQLSEAPAGVPARVHEFVFQGSTYAHRFVYNNFDQGR
jgi:hypothetical protein